MIVATCSASRAQKKVAKPLSASVSTTARPMPLVPPVTRAAPRRVDSVIVVSSLPVVGSQAEYDPAGDPAFQ
ncbi:hypothetical protein GCM10009848_28480 [Micromonospora lupini]